MVSPIENVTNCLLKCLVYRGGGKEGQFIKVNYHIQYRQGIDYFSIEVIELRPGFIKDKYPTQWHSYLLCRLCKAQGPLEAIRIFFYFQSLKSVHPSE